MPPIDIPNPRESKRAACLGLDPNLWYPELDPDPDEVAAFAAMGVAVVLTGNTGTHGHEASRVCAECPVMEGCAVWAVVNGEQHGIWGGMGAEGKLKWLRSVWAGDQELSKRKRAERLVELRGLIRTEQREIRRTYGHAVGQRDWQDPSVCKRCGDPIPGGRWPPDRNSENATCGRAVTYVKGCRCYRCRVVNAVRQFRY